jgi:hypothetical protein
MMYMNSFLLTSLAFYWPLLRAWDSKYRNGSRLASFQAQGFICCASYFQSWNNSYNSIQNMFMAGLIEPLQEVSRRNIKCEQSKFHRSTRLLKCALCVYDFYGKIKTWFMRYVDIDLSGLFSGETKLKIL